MDSLHALSPKFSIRTLVFMVILWVGLLCIAEVNASGGVGELLAKGVGSKQREFDYFKLALQWPGTYCRKTNRCCSTNGCCRGSNGPTGFTIHGLWADYNDGSWPSCCTSETFDVKEISSLDGAIYKYWPSLSCGSPSNCHGGKGLFWEHEWEKHGTCCVAVTGDEYNYFVTALNLYFKYNVTEVLAEAGYVASNSEKYPLGGIISAIQNAFHLTPSFKCTGDAVEEIYLCFTKEFTPRDCAGESKKSCPAYVSLPEYDSTKIGGAEREVSKFTLQSSI